MPKKAMIAVAWIAIGIMDAGWMCKSLDTEFFSTSHRSHLVFSVFIGMAGPFGFFPSAVITACGEDGWGFDKPDGHK